MATFFAKGDGAHVAIGQGPSGAASVWSEIGAGHAAWMTLDSIDPTQRMSWRETLVAKLRNVYPVGALTLSGSWNQLQSSGSGLAASYTGNRAISTGSLAAVAEVTVDRATSYDVWVHYTGRTSGGYVRVQIDGADTLVNEIDDPAGLGFKAFSSYSPTNLSRRQVVRVASGLSGPHTVSLSFGGAAAPGGPAILLEAVSTSADLTDARILPPLWQQGVSYAMGDEVQWEGMFYAARANGVSGSNPPTHMSGIGSDGALDWRADDRPTYPEFVAVDYPSEREYAMRFDVAGQVTEVGGQTHGNEPLLSRTIQLDGQPWVPLMTGTGLAVGGEITIVEQTSWQTGAGAVVADCTLRRTIRPGETRHDVDTLCVGPTASVEWFYPGMLPMVHWDGESQTEVVQSLRTTDQTVALSDYAGVNPPNVDLADSTRLGLVSALGTTALTYGMAVALESFGAAQVASFLRPNLDARQATGSLDWPAKAYVSIDVTNGFDLEAGDVLRFSSCHVMSARA